MTISDLAHGGITHTRNGGGVVIRIWGEVDAALRDDASAAMAAVLADPGPVVIDARDVTFIDSTGLAFILQLHKHGSEESREVVLRDPAPRLTELLELAAVGDLVRVERTPVPPTEQTSQSLSSR
ncbi:anti-sigma-factor antagonist [Beutenbergia cavernae DSM 12333]|uniref:Anti-sigma-factor antagonist n=1 Tax=Beutenbergia cavernae (strain ATCC BAA-8 / DSM 12333 / CCUG 43141 / JCM 11478 / NBRC 16432 / NCIMB 13614 / HKI 0122) TaxID=471853 RepID=C5BWA5_BEUC1|nr:STAS domain-containing protein [Beutenbergia cavernae]ACQ78563.1 anti-sigma-factor antagonist [Beutenbergia cavernae DSM 12333]